MAVQLVPCNYPCGAASGSAEPQTLDYDISLPASPMESPWQLFCFVLVLVVIFNMFVGRECALVEE